MQKNTTFSFALLLIVDNGNIIVDVLFDALDATRAAQVAQVCFELFRFNKIAPLGISLDP
jgi:hypothetical protein